MSRRVLGAPPPLPGYTYVRPLGSGGCADVYCYEQQLPRRTVAVKVLLADSSDAEMREMLVAEATLMAQLSSHPSVLTVHDAGMTPDGRPYLVTELCPSGYGSRYRTQEIALTEVLEVAIAVGSALETAHRAQVLHRDLKPSNVLVTRYGRPVLADFGVAATLARSARGDVVGLSVPWSAPEVIRGTTGGTVRSDVWGLAATTYALLARRSPFEVPGARDGVDGIRARILGRAAVAPTGRTDIPPSLEDVLAAALSKDPERRPASVLDLLHDLQLVQAELGLRPTPLDVDADPSLLPAGPTAPPAGATTGTGTGPTGSAGSAGSAGARRPRTSVPGRAGSRGRSGTGTGTATSADGTVLRAWDGAGPTGRSLPGARRGGPASPRRPRTAVGLLVGITAAAVVAVGALAVGGLVRERELPAVVGIEAAADDGGSVRFTWPDPGLGPDDAYVVRVDDGPGVVQRSRTFTVPVEDGDLRVCASVAVVRDGRTGPEGEATCARAGD